MEYSPLCLRALLSSRVWEISFFSSAKDGREPAQTLLLSSAPPRSDVSAGKTALQRCWLSVPIEKYLLFLQPLSSTDFITLLLRVIRSDLFELQLGCFQLSQTQHVAARDSSRGARRESLPPPLIIVSRCDTIHYQVKDRNSPSSRKDAVLCWHLKAVQGRI